MSEAWVIVICMLAFFQLLEVPVLIGVLRNIGSLEHRMRLAGFEDFGTKTQEIRESGPESGSSAPVIRGQPLNHANRRPGVTDSRRPYRLLVFLSSSCQSCQRVPEPLEEFARSLAPTLETAVVLKTDIDSAYRFLSVFEMDMPVFHEGSVCWEGADPIQFVPYWVLYGPDDRLARQGVIDLPDGMRVMTAIVRKEVGLPSERSG